MEISTINIEIIVQMQRNVLILKTISSFLILLLICMCSLCEGRTSFCTGLISRKLSGFSLMFWIGFTLFSFLSFFFLNRSSSILYMVFDTIPSNIGKGLLINPSANVFVLGDSNAHNKMWLTYSARTDRPGELFYNFSISNVFTQMGSFLTQIYFPWEDIFKLGASAATSEFCWGG